jgi:hypothetical protein
MGSARPVADQKKERLTDQSKLAHLHRDRQSLKFWHIDERLSVLILPRGTHGISTPP